MDHFAPKNYNAFLRLSLLVGAAFYLIGAITNIVSNNPTWDPLTLRIALGCFMTLGAVLSYLDILNERETETFAFGTGVISTCWVGLMLYANHLYILYVMAGYITIGVFPFIINNKNYIQLLLACSLVVLLPSMYFTSEPVLPLAGVMGLTVLIVLTMNFIAIKLLDSRNTLIGNQITLSRQLHDISAISNQLQIAEERLSHAISGNQDGVWDWNIPEDKLYLSPSWSSMLGYSEKETPANSVELHALIHPGDKILTQNSIDLFKQSGKSIYRGQFRVRAADGSYKYILSRGKSVEFSPEGEPIRIVGTHADISAQIEAEISARQAEMSNQALIDALPDMIFKLDLQGNFIMFKAENLSELIIKPEEILQQNISTVPFPEEVKTKLYSAIEAARVDHLLEIVEYPLMLPQGLMYYEARITRCTESEILCIIRNVTDRKIQHDALVLAKDKAEEAAVARSQFLSTMSHEIRTPLNAIIGISHLLMQESPKPEQMDLLNTLQFSSENLLVIINDVLDYSKIESGKIDFEQTPISLGSISSFVARSLQQIADEKHLDLVLNVDPEIPLEVLGDPTRLGQILTNLVNNAIKFTERGSVHLSLKLDMWEADIAWVKFSVKDTGIGIPADKLEVIFDSFTQASADHTRKYGGTGLGLAICKRLLELQQSQLMVESTVGCGSEFYFSLAFQLPEAIAPEKETRNNFQITDFQSLKGVRVLLVEDNLVNQKIATKFLEKWDIQVNAAVNGLIALEKLANHSYDLILMDLQMPVMDGYTAARKIRENTAWNHIPMLALTANAMQDAREEVMELGMQDYISKPFNPRDLYRKIATHTHQVEEK